MQGIVDIPQFGDINGWTVVRVSLGVEAIGVLTGFVCVILV